MKEKIIPILLFFLFVLQSKAQQIGQFTDPRDSSFYTTVQIGNQIWMAENLRYQVNGSRIYGDKEQHLHKFGRLYTWSQAQQACPAGWHLPSKAEWARMEVALGVSDSVAQRLDWRGTHADLLKAPKLLEKKENVSNLNIVPTGYYDGHYFNLGKSTYLWLSNERGTESALCIMISANKASVYVGPYSKNVAQSVRCVRD